MESNHETLIYQWIEGVGLDTPHLHFKSRLLAKMPIRR